MNVPHLQSESGGSKGAGCLPDPTLLGRCLQCLERPGGHELATHVKSSQEQSNQGFKALCVPLCLSSDPCPLLNACPPGWTQYPS